MLNKENITEQEIFQTLEDVGMEQQQAERFAEYLRAGQTREAKNLLLAYRSELLSSVHICQEKLYRIDFLVRSLQS